MTVGNALDKAREVEMVTAGGDAGEDSALIAPRPGGEDKETGKVAEVVATGWQPPVYSESVAVRLDPQRLIRNRCVCISADAPELDAYKILRTRIRQLIRQRGMNTIMVTSARPGEGKTVTTINLALTFAREYQQTVLLVDCDLKKQDIRACLGFASDRGLVDYLEHNRPLKDCIIWPGVEKMTVISGGRTVADSTELLGSPKMRELLIEMKNRYDDRCVLLDVPAVLAGADAMVFAPLVDCIVMVVEQGVTPLAEVKKAVGLLPEEKFFGFVLNDRQGR